MAIVSHVAGGDRNWCHISTVKQCRLLSAGPAFVLDSRDNVGIAGQPEGLDHSVEIVVLVQVLLLVG